MSTGTGLGIPTPGVRYRESDDVTCQLRIAGNDDTEPEKRVGGEVYGVEEIVLGSFTPLARHQRTIYERVLVIRKAVNGEITELRAQDDGSDHLPSVDARD